MKKLLFLLTFLSTNVLATPVNINKADAQTIADSLNGIGLVKAQALVDYRTVNGDFTTIESLTNVSGIGEKTIEKNKADILLSEPTSSEKASDSKAKK